MLFSNLEHKPSGSFVTNVTKADEIDARFAESRATTSSFYWELIVHGNLIVNSMPRSVADDLMGAGGEFRIAAGEQISPDLLGGSHVFIVTEGIASKFQRTPSGRIAEVGVIGREGLLPVSALLRVPSTPHIVVAHVGPFAGRVLRAKDFWAIVDASEEASLLVRKYSYAFFAQVTSNLITSEQAPIAARVARSLLMCHDRIDGDEVEITHDVIAHMTAAHRPTVTHVLHEMRDQGLISISRRCITIYARAALRDIAGGTYGMSEAYWNEHIGPFGRDADEPLFAKAA